MPRRAILFVIVNILISAGVAFAIISLNPGGSDDGGTERQVTFVVVHTATRDPNATEIVRIITATPDPFGSQAVDTGTTTDNDVNIPDDILAQGNNPGTPIATLDPTLVSQNPELENAVANLPAGCIPHPLADGENPSIVASIYGVTTAQVLQASGLAEDDATFLQIGEILIVPLEGCPLGSDPIVVAGDDDEDDGREVDGTPSDNVDATEEVDGTPQPGVTPTITLAPTAIDAQVEIVGVVGRGDITTEGIEILNTGGTINISGWVLNDSQGNEFVFPNGRRLSSNASVTVFTRTGQGTPVILYWGEDTALYESGETLILYDADGEAQATFTIP